MNEHGHDEEITNLMDRLYCGDCMSLFQDMPAGCVDLAFLDPPYNIGFDYQGEYADNLPPQEYENWCDDWLAQIYRVLAPDGSFWLAIGDEWAAELKVLATRNGFFLRSWVIWYYTFGVNCENKFSRSHAHLLYFTKHPKRFTFNKESIRVPSARAAVYNDKRANPLGRLPDDTWMIRPQQQPDGFPADGNTWHIPRICGTFNERRDEAANQLPEQLIGRIIRACSNPGNLVFDAMMGTGTVPAVAKKLSRRYLGFDQSFKYTTMATERVASVKPGDALDGPIPQGG